MLVAGCSLLVEDPVFSGDKDFPIYSAWKYYQFIVRSFSKDKKVIKFLISFPLKTGFPHKYPETSIQYLYTICTTIY